MKTDAASAMRAITMMPPRTSGSGGRASTGLGEGSCMSAPPGDESDHGYRGEGGEGAEARHAGSLRAVSAVRPVRRTEVPAALPDLLTGREVLKVRPRDDDLRVRRLHV